MAPTRTRSSWARPSVPFATRFDSGDFRNVVPRFTPENRKANLAFVEWLEAFAARRGATPAQIALAWILAQKPWIVFPQPRTMSPLDWMALVVSLGSVASDGLRRSRGCRNFDHYARAERALPWYAMALSIMATQASAVTFISTPGQAREDGALFLPFSNSEAQSRTAKERTTRKPEIVNVGPQRAVPQSAATGGKRRLAGLLRLLTGGLPASARLRVGCRCSASYGQTSPKLRIRWPTLGCGAQAGRFESYLRSQSLKVPRS